MLKKVALFIVIVMVSLVIFGTFSVVKAATFQELNPEYKQCVMDNCTVTGLDPYIVLALIQTESGNDPTAVSSDGKCYGLCQINKCWSKKAAEYGCDLFVPEDNITWCCKMLSDAYVKYCDFEKALVVYNSGKLYANSTPYSRRIVALAADLRASDEKANENY